MVNQQIKKRRGEVDQEDSRTELETMMMGEENEMMSNTINNSMKKVMQ